MANQEIKNKIKQKFVNMLFNGDERLQEDLKWNYCNLKKKGTKELRYLFVPDTGMQPPLTIHPIDESGEQFAPTIQAHRIYCVCVVFEKGKYRLLAKSGLSLSSLGIEVSFGWAGLKECFLAHAQPNEKKLYGWVLDLEKDENKPKARKTKSHKSIYPIEMHRMIVANYKMKSSKMCDKLYDAGYRNQKGGRINGTGLYNIKTLDFYGLFAKHKV